mmetsp:Transcript_4367/g.5952  ORF Transcript_4367/g.5952 Transcript_4367/m.5952 type:complete len:120 (-) Transcript_4367:945-1304(-)
MILLGITSMIVAFTLFQGIKDTDISTRLSPSEASSFGGIIQAWTTKHGGELLVASLVLWIFAVESLIFIVFYTNEASNCYWVRKSYTHFLLQFIHIVFPVFIAIRTYGCSTRSNLLLLL